jgi:hypothetical protein
VGGTLVVLGTAVFTWNVLAVIKCHSPHGIPITLLAMSGRGAGDA